MLVCGSSAGDGDKERVLLHEYKTRGGAVQSFTVLVTLLPGIAITASVRYHSEKFGL